MPFANLSPAPFTLQHLYLSTLHSPFLYLSLSLSHMKEEPIDADFLHSIQPSPSLPAEKVIEIQLMAMKFNDVPNKDSGIALVFKFASPGSFGCSFFFFNGK